MYNSIQYTFQKKKQAFFFFFTKVVIHPHSRVRPKQKREMYSDQGLIALGVLRPALLMVGAQCDDDVAHAHGEEHETQHGHLPLRHSVLDHAQQQCVAVVELEALQ